MPKVEVSRVIKAPRGKVWEVAADPESMLRWWPGVESPRVDILSREGNTITIRGMATVGGREVTMTEKWTLHPPEKIEMEILEGPILGKTIQTYEEVPEGTKVTWSSDVHFKGVLGKILGLFVGSRVKDSVGQPLEEMAKYIEAQ
ncbi:MAG: SRPBCC family protein [Candidatus Methylarchaceae archaeon HK02M2]|nr:SRPBCC family protein [Candidatus Methylarchaceae archaeon HK02M2]